MSTPPTKRPANNYNRGRRFEPDPITVEDVAQLLAACVPLKPGRSYELSALRLRALIVLLYRTGLRISEALALEEADLRPRDQAIVVRRGKGAKRRIVLMDPWGWGELDAWLQCRREIEPGAVICVLTGRTAGRSLAACDVRRQLHGLQRRSGVRRRIYAHGLRHGFSVEFYREKKDLLALQGQLGHVSLNTTAIYLRGIDPLDQLAPIGQRQPPMMAIPSPYDHTRLQPPATRASALLAA